MWQRKKDRETERCIENKRPKESELHHNFMYSYANECMCVCVRKLGSSQSLCSISMNSMAVHVLSFGIVKRETTPQVAASI